ncbi:TPA: hypothetical protein N0F65_005087 [Lagenidium giganteum]|uniref:Uncharacterized protein n=1 Tax=Lagenidium giganteum TaxID=4803 RepID=A0AAV2Z4M7_9STRA|nr:TPA: hypothetical protein N0F65_005087 [Lagenidium giganteum]
MSRNAVMVRISTPCTTLSASMKSGSMKTLVTRRTIARRCSYLGQHYVEGCLYNG